MAEGRARFVTGQNTMYYLNEAQQQLLIHQPETGMGYQLVEVTNLDYRRIIGIAYNAELVLERDDPYRAVSLRAFALGVLRRDTGSAVREVRMLARDSVEYRMFMVGETQAIYGAKQGPAKAAPVQQTKAGEMFKRFSAYENDKRIRADGSLEPGTYATTEEDARHVLTGKEAVRRYALPNPEPAVNVFIIKPVIATPIQSGIAQPAYGQPGGGVEVVFTAGTTRLTVTGREKIPTG